MLPTSIESRGLLTEVGCKEGLPAIKSIVPLLFTTTESILG